MLAQVRKVPLITLDQRFLPEQESFMDAASTTGAVHRPGRGRVFDSIVDAIGDTPIVRLLKLPQARGANATILAKLEYFNPAASVKDRIGAAMITAMEKAGLINADTLARISASTTDASRVESSAHTRSGSAAAMAL